MTRARRPAAGFRPVFGCALAVLLAGCGSMGGARPRWSALPDAVLMQSDRPPVELLGELYSVLRTRGFAIDLIAPREGFLETRWYDLSSRTATEPPFRHFDRIVKLRFFADPVQGRTRLLAECVRRIAWDPSLPERELERMVPLDHPGRLLLDSLIAPFKPDTTAGPPLR